MRGSCWGVEADGLVLNALVEAVVERSGRKYFCPQAMRRATTQLFLSKLPTVESLAQLARVYDEIEL